MTRLPFGQRSCLIVLGAALFVALLLARPVLAGSGVVNADGTIDITLNFRFPPSPAARTALRNQVIDASRLLWDASEGQMRIGRVTIACSAVNEDLADYWIFANPIRSNSPIDSLGVRGAHINQFFGDIGGVFAHEFGHLGFGLGDEYTESQTNCGGVGWCIEETPPAFTERNQCLMQQSPGVSWSEFCMATNHDLVRGNNATCRVNPPDPDGAPCAAACERWNTTTHLYETCGQSPSCWEALAAKFAFLVAPAGLPLEAPPAGFVDPVFTETCTGADSVLLLLDRSGSMAWNVSNDWGEVCGNGLDDDLDGAIDETDDCAGARIEFVRAAARSYLALSGAGTFRAGIVSFNQTPTNDVRPVLGADFVDVGANLATLQGLVDGLAPGGNTAIGDSLTFGKGLFDADPAPAASKTVLLVTDGVNTAGSAPASAVPAYQAAGIRIFVLSTGQASDDATLTAVSTATRGTRLDSRDGTALVPSLVELWAGYTNGGILLPQMPYGVDLQSKSDDAGSPVFAAAAPSASRYPRRNRFNFLVEPGTRQVTGCLAGNMRLMTGFGVRARFRSPSGAVLDTDAPAPPLRVTADRFFTLALIDSPDAGTWEVEVTAKAGASPIQTGRLIVVSDNPRTDLFVDADRYVVTSPAETVRLSLFPSYVTGLRDVVWDVTLTRPDGVSVPVAVHPSGRPFAYQATLNAFPYSGLYTVTATVRTDGHATNDPGESRPGTAPSNTVAVPPLVRTRRLQLYADVGRTLDPPPTHRGDFGTPPRPGGFDPKRLRYALRLGSAHPVGSLDTVSDSNVALRLDLGYEATPSFSGHLSFGLSQFTAESPTGLRHPRFLDASLDARFSSATSTGLRPYLQAGPGVYVAKSGSGFSSAAGMHAGVGAEIPIGGVFRLELGADYHLSAKDSARFLTVTLGASFR